MKLSPLFLFLFPLNLVAATLTGTLKPSAVNLGNSAILTLRYEGGTTSTVQQTTTPKNLALTLVSSGEEISLVNVVEQISIGFILVLCCPHSALFRNAHVLGVDAMPQKLFGRNCICVAFSE